MEEFFFSFFFRNGGKKKLERDVYFFYVFLGLEISMECNK